MTLNLIRTHVRLIARIGNLDVVPHEDGGGVMVYAENDRVEVVRSFELPADINVDELVDSLKELRLADWSLGALETKTPVKILNFKH